MPTPLHPSYSTAHDPVMAKKGREKILTERENVRPRQENVKKR